MSTNLINNYKEQIEDAKDKINAQILKLRRLPSNEKDKLAAEILDSLKKTRSLFKKFKKEIANVPDSERDRWERKKKELYEDLTKLTTQFNNAKDLADRDELFDNQDKKPSKPSNKESKVEVYEDENGKKKVRHEALEEELFKEIYALQDESLSIVQRLLSKADEASELATDTQQVLAAQREQLERIDEEMDKLGSNITRAGREITSFMRRMATDVFILILCAFATCVAIVSVVMVIVCKTGVCSFVLKKINEARGSIENNSNGLSSEIVTNQKCFKLF